MTRDEAIKRAIEHVDAAALEVGPVVSVRYFDIDQLDELAKDCPPDMLETYRSVRSKFRNQWVVSFWINALPGQVRSPSTQSVSVFDDGETMLVSHP